MNFFWSNVFDYFKDRRFAAVFFGTLMVLTGLLAAGFLMYQFVLAYQLQGYLVYTWPVFSFAFLVWFGRVFKRARDRRHDRYKSSPLSRDELNKARSKLIGTKR